MRAAAHLGARITAASEGGVEVVGGDGCTGGGCGARWGCHFVAVIVAVVLQAHGEIGQYTGVVTGVTTGGMIRNDVMM